MALLALKNSGVVPLDWYGWPEGPAGGPGRQVLEAFSCWWEAWLPGVWKEWAPH